MHKLFTEIKKVDKKRLLIGVIVLVCAIVILGAILLISKNNKPDGSVGSEGTSSDATVSVDEKYLPASDSAHYVLGFLDPELKEDAITSVVNEMYYTNGGYLYMHITFGNGSDKAVELQGLDVEVKNGYSNELIAELHTNDVTRSLAPQGIKISAGGTARYKLYIDPAQVKIAYDTFEAPLFRISASSRVVKE